MSVTVPEGLSELLEEFAVSVLREKPTDLLEFAARYFNDLYMSRKREGGKHSAAVVSELAGAAEVEMDAEGDLLSLPFVDILNLIMVPLFAAFFLKRISSSTNRTTQTLVSTGIPTVHVFSVQQTLILLNRRWWGDLLSQT